MSIIMVVDPDFKGDPNAPAATLPMVPRAWAMRKLFAQGMKVGDIGRKYGVPYSMAYKAINPPHLPAGAPGSTQTKPLSVDRLSRMTKSQLEAVALTKQKDIKSPDQLARVQAAADELDRRFPGWAG